MTNADQEENGIDNHPNHDCDGEEEEEEEDPSKYLIRAAQGHSIAIEHSSLLTPLTLETAPAIVVHGTYRKAWPLILSSNGLKRMSRTLIHCAPAVHFAPILSPASPLDASSSSSFTVNTAATTATTTTATATPLPEGSSLPGAAPERESVKVISGARSTADVHIYIDVHRSMREAGLQWWRSDNHVILTEGDPSTGLLSTQFFVKAVEKPSGKHLWEDGHAVREK